MNKMNNMNYSSFTLGELLSSKDKIILRNAMSILKQLQKTSKDGRCWAQVGDDYCRKKAIHDSDYCKEHKEEFMEEKTVSFHCAGCDIEESWTEKEIIEQGTPICPKCDEEMI